MKKEDENLVFLHFEFRPAQGGECFPPFPAMCYVLSGSWAPLVNPLTLKVNF
jgi:hypothetical protein